MTLIGYHCNHGFELWAANPPMMSDIWGHCHHEDGIEEECIPTIVEIPISDIKGEFGIDFDNGEISEEYLERSEYAGDF